MTERERPRVAVIAGAGLSAPAGIPTAGQLTSILESLSSHLDDPWSKRIETLFHASRLRLAIARDCAPTEIDFEAAVGALSELASERSRDSSALFALDDPAIGSARRDGQLQPSMERVFALIRNQLDAAPVQSAYLDPLIQCLDEHCSKIDFFTLNYDLMIEHSLDRAHIAYEDGFQRSEVDQLDIWTRQNTTAKWSYHKLHGSVDWAFYSAGLDNHEGRTPPRLLRLPSWRTARLGMPSDSLNDLTSAMNLGARKEVLYSAEPYTFMLNRLDESLAAADLVVVIGYSFRDLRINGAIESALWKVSGSHLIVINPDMLAYQLLSIYKLLSTQGRLTTVFDSISSSSCVKSLDSVLAKSREIKSFPHFVHNEASIAYGPDDMEDEEDLDDPNVVAENWQAFGEVIDGLLLLQERLWSRSILPKKTVGRLGFGG
ncbi:MAG: SIR2 family protein [Dehalococcoidia bacterium]